MAGELIYDRGTQFTLEANGATIANNAIGQADDANYDTSSNGGGRPHGEFALTSASGSNLTENTVIDIVAQPLDIDGTADTTVPTATYRPLVVGSFVVKAATANNCYVQAFNLPKLATYWLYNNNTGQTISAGWTLKVTPFSYKAA